jgi:hypothetical protein
MNVLRKIWNIWKPIGQAIADFVARVILTIFYFTLYAPFGIGVRLFGDRLHLKHRASIRWQERTTGDRDLSEARRLF